MKQAMAKRSFRRSQSKQPDPPPSGEEGGLSTPMRELILSFDAQDRRTRRRKRGAEGAAEPAKRRRRTDQHKTDHEDELAPDAPESSTRAR